MGLQKQTVAFSVYDAIQYSQTKHPTRCPCLIVRLAYSCSSQKAYPEFLFGGIKFQCVWSINVTSLYVPTYLSEYTR